MAPKRKGSTVFENEEQAPKRRLRSGRIIETSPLRLAKVVSASASLDDSNPRVNSFTSTKSAMKIPRVVDIEDELDENHDEICLTPLQPSQAHLHSCLNAQKRAILRTLQHPKESDNLSAVNEIATRQLADLMEGTMIRAEGNSCLLLGPRGSGKSRLIKLCIDNLKAKPIVLRLSGWLQPTDRHALREIGFQLLQQTGLSILEDSENMPSNTRDEGATEDDENPFLDSSDTQIEPPGPSISLPPSSHLHTLIPILSTLDRPVIVVLDAFDLFALHPRQSLLYCLLDTVQNCRASSRNRGIAVIGITNRVDTIQLLEKRVKSRFSGRTIRTAPPNTLAYWTQLARDILHTPALDCNDEFEEDWKQRWTASVDKLLADKAFSNVLNETFSITRDVRTLVRILTTAVLQLNPTAPYLSLRSILASVESQRARPRYPHLMNISYPSMCLLIASVHADTAGHSTFTFEMLFNNFQDQARASTSAPVQVNGGSIGMVRCTRQIFMNAFEHLVAASLFIAVVAPSFNVAKEFLKYRCAVERDLIKGAVEKSGQVTLKKWLNRAQ
ncbi:hypothetical protein BYT27DRAFT_7182913 [Phlegmacium glaucopus]|nr:hypothetical protein BYT27DRAFT_7182913 [Phlegmacium glaucopus]